MRKIKHNYIYIFLCLIITTFMFVGCGTSPLKTPTEQELMSGGLSLKEALPLFTALEDNYTYRQKVQQMNGEDWFNYSLVKLDNEDIYSQEKRYNSNAGYQFEDEAFTYDSVNNGYTVFAKQDENYTIFRKGKYNESDEEFTRFSYSYDLPDNNARASAYYFDYSFFQENMFEYYQYTDGSNELCKVWRVKESLLLDSTFKTNLLNAFNRSTETVSEDRIDFVYFNVSVNRVSKITFEYSNAELEYFYRIETTFSYDDYEFDTTSLTSGFTPYVPD